MSNTKSQAITHFNDGGKLYKVNLFSEALEQYQKALDNDPTFHDAHFCLAKTLVRLKKYNEGIQHFSKYIHLIPKGKQGTYILALSNILIDEKQQEKALSLTESIDVSFTEKQVFDYVPLLLTNNKIEKAVHLIINLKDRNQINKGYKALLENDKISNQIIESLKNDDFVPRFFGAVKKIELLKAVDIQNKDYKSKIGESISLLKEVKNDKNTDYNEALNEVESLVLTLQNLLEKQGNETLKSGDIPSAKKTLSVLENTKYNSEKCKVLTEKITTIEKEKSKKTLKIAVISIASILIVSFGSYFAYNSYQKSEAYKQALSSKYVYVYSNYLNKYGDDDAIHKLREDKLYEMAVLTHKGSDINKLSQLYPKSKYLRKITISIENDDVKPYCYGIGNQNEKINILQKNTIHVPVGSKIGYRINEFNKIPIDKIFTVIQNINITEPLIELKTEVFRDDFDDNRNNWDLKYENKYGHNIYKVAINQGALIIENGRNEPSLYTYLKNKVLNRKDNFEIITEIKANRRSSHGFHILFDATPRAFSHIGYAGFTNNSSYNIGHNNLDDSSNSWISYIDGWQRYKYSSEMATLTVRKENNKLVYLINGSQVAESPIKKRYGTKVGFHSTADTRTIIDYLIINRINKKPKINFKKDQVYYCWVNELNVRDASNKGEILTTIKIGDPVKFLGEVGSKKLNATFKEQFKPDYYYKVQLTNGVIGWVHGGALCEINSSENIEFSNFKSVDELLASKTITKRTTVN